MKKVDALAQFKKSGMSYSDMMKNCQIYAAGIRTEETLLAKNLYGNLRRHGLLGEVRPEVKVVEPLVDGIPYSKILKLRKEYVQGLRNEDTKHANAIYQRMLRRGWHTGLRLRCNAITKRDGEQQ